MNIKLLDSWVREYLTTKATAKEIAEKLSLTSVSIERIEPFGKDFVYDIEVTTNRVDLANVVGIAREAAAVLPQFGIPATFNPPTLVKPSKSNTTVPLEINNDPQLVDRVCAVVMEVTVKQSPQYIKDRLEHSEIRSLNNIIDATNYIMRTIGHPAHVFDYDRIAGHLIKIRESKKGETITTLDKKTHTLLGGDIVAEDKEGRIIDLLGVMGLENSVVTNNTKRIILFLDNNNTAKIRKTSMGLGIRTDAAQLNEKGIDPELAMDALLFGIQLYQDIADATVISEIIDIYPNKPKQKTISVSTEKINAVMGVDVPVKTSVKILEDLGFTTKLEKSTITAIVPSSRIKDMDIAEDVIEEIARVYGYHNLPSVLPPQTTFAVTKREESPYFWEEKVRHAFKYWGFTETYTYSFVSEDLYEGPLEDGVQLQNPLSSDWVYMRKTLIPSLLEVIKQNKGRESVSIFEIANVYEKKTNSLPQETRMLAGVIKKKHVSFYEAKGILEQLLEDIGVSSLTFGKRKSGGLGADVHIGKDYVGEIEVLDEEIVDFELNFETVIKHATTKKIYKPIAKYPPIVEDISFVLPADISTGNVLDEIKKKSPLIVSVSLLDIYENTRTFHVVYQDMEKNLTTEEVAHIREKIVKDITTKFKAEVK